VYSACGSLWVDDHLVTDDMIESVAEVNGYAFPNDFALRSEVPTIENVIAAVIKDDEIAEDSTWSSNKIKGEIDRIYDYSTTEKIIGKWIDNSAVYEQTIVLQNPITITANHSVGVSADDYISNTYKVIKVIALSNETALPSMQVGDLQPYSIGFAYDKAGNNFLFSRGNGGNVTLTDVIIIIQYIKS
jgi:hypothetical protein